MNYSKNKRFISEMFDEISPFYDRMNHLMSGWQDLRWRKQAVKYLQSLNRKYDFILDLAAGTGDFGKEFLKLNPLNLFSADISTGMLEINKKKLNIKTNIPIITDAEKLPFKENFIDLCGIAFGIRNFENLESSLKEIFRILKPGGLLYIIEMFKPQRNNLFNKFFKIYFNTLVPKIGNFISRSSYAYNYLHYSVDNFLNVESFIYMANQNGFKFINKTKKFSDIVYSLCLEKNSI